MDKCVRFLPIASSSKGNCTFVGSKDTSILVDCGISLKRISETLNHNDIDPSTIDAIFITHEHQDHIKGIGVISRKYKIPIYATTKTIECIKQNDKLGKIDESLFHPIYKEEYAIINDIKVLPFAISHDAIDPVGYNFFISDKKVSICTDLGIVTDIIVEKLSCSNILLIESNHDIKMLENGDYPYILKKRILGQHGHISNVACGKLLTTLDSSNLSHVFLGHLSDENNRPILALDTVKTITTTHGFDEKINITLAETGYTKQVLHI